MCVVLLPSGSCCLPVSLLDSRCLGFLPCSFYPAEPGEDLRKRADRNAVDSIQLIQPVDGLLPICSSDVDSDDVVG